MLDAHHFEHIYADTRIKCPECSDERKNKRAKTLAVTLQGERCLYYCHHCHIAGKVDKKPPLQKLAQVRAISVPKTFDTAPLHLFLQERHVDLSVLDKFPIISGNKYFSDRGEVASIGFVYGDKEAVKWRSVEGKSFTQDGAARSLWMIENVPDKPETMLIAEGELDAISWASSGVQNCVSVPNGAPAKISAKRVSPEEDVKFHYVWDAREKIEQCNKIILATDYDKAGVALQEELARRIGRAKCYYVEYPSDCKDANDVLVKHGAEYLKKLADEAKPMPLEGVYAASEYETEINTLYEDGVLSGVSTGISTLDALFKVVPSQLTIVTGIPGSGKSEFIDMLMVNLAKRESWKFAVASFENPPALHIAKLCEKYIEKPFFKGNTERMNEQEKEAATEWVANHFLFLEQRSGDNATIDSILDRAKQAVMRLGVRGLVIDPYNYIAQSSGVENEHIGINEMLTRLVNFARANDVHIWFIAHPAKMMTNADGSTPVPKGMNISGSASFFAKADIGLTVHLDSDKNVQIHCWKCRFKWVGQTGCVPLDYDIPTGIYSDIEYPEFDIEPSATQSKGFGETDDDWDF